MAVLPIIHVPSPVLKEVAQPVQEITADILRQLDDMAETMYEAPGIGLAAPQIGMLNRLIVMDCADDGEAPELWQMINPEIIHLSDETSELTEGCLSIPGHTASVTRPAEVKVRFTTPKGAVEEMQATGLLAACVQHEIDHLNGVLFIDHLSRLKKNMIWRKVLKESKSRGED